MIKLLNRFVKNINIKWTIAYIVITAVIIIYLNSCGSRYSLTPIFYDHGCCEVVDGEVVERK